jgi:hypothetical protein
MNWRRGRELSLVVPPLSWYNRVSGETAGHEPNPVGPHDPAAGVKVYHWPGVWCVGSLTAGKGSLIASEMHEGFAQHV